MIYWYVELKMLTKEIWNLGEWGITLYRHLGNDFKAVKRTQWIRSVIPEAYVWANGFTHVLHNRVFNLLSSSCKFTSSIIILPIAIPTNAVHTARLTWFFRFSDLHFFCSFYFEIGFVFIEFSTSKCVILLLIACTRLLLTSTLVIVPERMKYFSVSI